LAPKEKSVFGAELRTVFIVTNFDVLNEETRKDEREFSAF
jgi:hypothetical protein